jgi:hypothetical protein
MANNFENIDRYFGGEMGAEEMQQFESSINQDPVLKEEFNFQQELVDGIQSARKAELKSMLNNVDVTGTAALESGTLTQILGGIAAVGLVAVGAYFYLGDKQTETPEVSITTSESVVLDTPETSDLSTEEIQDVVQQTAPLPQKTTPIESTTNNEIKEEASPIVISEAHVMEDFEDEEEVSETEAPTNHLIAKSKVTNSTLEVKVEESKRYSFHYQVKNNALSLFGEFTSLYEIIEFHKDGNITTYFKYVDKYYKIDKQQSKATPLIELTGDGLLSLLDSIENNKER